MPAVQFQEESCSRADKCAEVFADVISRLSDLPVIERHHVMVVSVMASQSLLDTLFKHRFSSDFFALKTKQRKS